MNDLISLIETVIGRRVVLTADTPLLSSALIDSFKFSELLARIEARHGIAIDVSEVGVDNFDTPAQIAAYLRSHRP
jgi:acyl carrier protein